MQFRTESRNRLETTKIISSTTNEFTTTTDRQNYDKLRRQIVMLYD